MAITFIQQKRRQRYMIWILAGVILIGLILVWQVVLKPGPVFSPSVSPQISKMAKKIEINFDLFKSPLSVALPAFSVKLEAEPSSGSAPLKAVGLLASIQGSVIGPFIYKFDCNNDGTYEKEVSDNVNNYRAQDLCNYEKEGNYTAKVLVENTLTYFSKEGEKKTEKKNTEATTVISVKSANNPPMISYCDVSSTEGTTQTDFKFKFLVEATDLDKDSLNYRWDFGDGQSSTEQNPAYSYEKPGNFVPIVTVSDGKGGEAVCSPSSLSKLKDFKSFEEINYPKEKIGRENPFVPY